MSDKRIEVDIAAAVALLQESPELCEVMNKLVGVPALNAALAEIELLRAERDALREALEAENIVTCTECKGSGFSGNGTGYDAVCGTCGGQGGYPAPTQASERAEQDEIDAQRIAAQTALASANARAERAEAELKAMRALLRPALDFICAHGDREDEGDQGLANGISAALASSPAGEKS